MMMMVRTGDVHVVRNCGIEMYRVTMRMCVDRADVFRMVDCCIGVGSGKERGGLIVRGVGWIVCGFNVLFG